MNQLMSAMSHDLGVAPYAEEPSASFSYRVIYSGLGEWCLKLATDGISKIGMTKRLNELVQHMANAADVLEYFTCENEDAGRTIREQYEFSGCIALDENNRLHFVRGLPNFTSIIERDGMTNNEFIRSQYCALDFDDVQDYLLQGAEYFAPTANCAFSRAWRNTPLVERTVLRTAMTDNRDYYRVMVDGSRKYIAKLSKNPIGTLDENEYRRLYYELRAFYGNPVSATKTQLDKQHIRIMLQSHLPMREYTALRHIAWPESSLFEKRRFIAKVETLPTIQNILSNIGIIVR